MTKLAEPPRGTRRGTWIPLTALSVPDVGLGEPVELAQSPLCEVDLRGEGDIYSAARDRLSSPARIGLNSFNYRRVQFWNRPSYGRLKYYINILDSPPGPPTERREREETAPAAG